MKTIRVERDGRPATEEEILACINGEPLPPARGYLARVGPLPRREISEAIRQELDHAYGKHGRDQWGRHEFYAVLKEEVDELWDAIKADLPQAKVREEALQVAAMCFRYLETADRYREPANDSSSATSSGSTKLTKAD